MNAEGLAELHAPSVYGQLTIYKQAFGEISSLGGPWGKEQQALALTTDFHAT